MGTSAAPDELVARIAAIDDYIDGRVGREAIDASAAAAIDADMFTAMLDTVLLLRQSAAADGFSPPPPAAGVPDRIGRYEPRSRAGEGGFATVWEAWDPLLRRRVALKVRRAETLLSTSARRRFIREAEIASRLVHPQIVTIYEVGTDDGYEFIAQEFCAGGSLAGWLDGHPGPMEPRTAARLVLTLARAAAHAHEEGVIHRDIKPGNVLLAPVTISGQGRAILESDEETLAGFTVKLADFGLGKVREDDAGDPLTQLTRTGASLGTPAWMAPEQIDPAFGAVGPATDVHSLGLLLDRLLTGRMSCGGTTAETYRHVMFAEPEPADRIVRNVPRDLAAVCLKCLAKRPTDRYPSAAAFADDLDRWLDGRPTLVRPLPAVARLARAIGRRPLIATLLAAALTAATLAGWAVVERSRAARRAEAQRQEIARRDAAAELRRGFEALRGGNVSASLAHATAARTLDPAHGDSLASRWLRRRMHGEREILVAPPAGEAGDRPRDLYAIALASRGKTAAMAGADGNIRLVRGLDGVARTTVVPAHDEVNDVCFSADGGLLASVGQDGVVRWWEVADDSLVAGGAVRPGTGALYAVAFTADGRSLAVGGEDRVVRLVPLDAPDPPRQLFRFDPPPDQSPEVESLVTISADRIAAACGDAVVLLDTATGAVLREFERPSELSRKTVLGSLTVSPDGGRLMACGTDTQAHVWDIATGKRVASLPSHPAWVQGCAFAGDGTQAVTACRDGGVRVFDLETSALCRRLVGHVGRVWAIVSEPGGTLLTAGADGTLRRWDPQLTSDAAALREVPVPGRQIDHLVMGPPAAGSRNGRAILAVDGLDTAWQLDLATGGMVPVTAALQGIQTVDFDAARERLAMASGRLQPITTFTFAAGAGLATGAVSLPAAVHAATTLCWSRRGELVVADKSSAVFVLSPSLDHATPLTTLADPVHDLAAAPADPPRVAAAGRRTAIIPLDTRREPIWIEIGEDSWSVAWSPDGGLVAVGTRTGRVLFFDGLTGEPRGALTSHERLIEDLAFSTDGRCLVTADEGCVRISDVATLTTFDELRPGWQVRDILLLPDETGLVIAGCDPGTSRLAVARLALMKLDRP